MHGGMKALVPVLFVAAVVVSSGCVNIDPTAFARTLPMVQDFLDDHPNAEINIIHYTAAEAEAILDLIKEDCGKLAVEPKEYYFVNITDPTTDLVVRAWIDWESQVVECIYKEGSTVDPDECVSLHSSRCFNDHVYWFDSCGNREEKKEYCPLGCSNGECAQGRICETDKSYTDRPECVCPDGYEMIKLYARCADSVTGAVTGMPFAITEQVADKAVTTVGGSVEISSEFTTEYQERCPDTKPVYRCVKQVQCRSRAQARCYKDHVYWFDSCGHVQEKKQYCSEGCDQGFCKEKRNCEKMGGYCVYPDQVACTEDARQCPDGSFVSRVPPECEFAPCPSECDDDSTDDVESCSDSVTGQVHDVEPTTTSSSSGGGSGAAYPTCRDGYARTDDYACPRDGLCCLPEKRVCEESDRGYDVYNKGCTETADQRLCDHCNDDGTLTEKYCSDSGDILAKTEECPDGYECEDAACVKQGCVEAGGYMQGTVSPEYQTRCCEGLEGFETSSGLVGAPLLCYDPEKGKPVCKSLNDGVEKEGWYYSNGQLLRHEECEDMLTCYDSDDGLDYDTAGAVEKGDDRKEDYCSGDSVVEYYCKDDGSIGIEDFECDVDCDEGACLEAECEQGDTLECDGSDTGICDPGFKTCVEGSWSSECSEAVYPTNETCSNQLDDDCDGTVDEGCEFCGTSTNFDCLEDTDCAPGGCSSQVCAGVQENVSTTCEYLDCYDSQLYNVTCSCYENQCQWTD